ncbi:MAG: type II toxin-antitoxin system VapC family toxin [Candidatus Parabeggiatoa sp.]|nr:type II toxin-antitoxin system VapC family toxin [Candidatus Parabeggiatoa sp.]
MESNLTQVDYFDSSALVKRYLSEMGSIFVQKRCSDANRIIVTSEISRVEVAAAFAAKRRGQLITQADYQKMTTQFKQDCQQQYFLIPVDLQCIDEAVKLTGRQK